MLRSIEPSLTSVAGLIDCEDADLLAAIYGLAGLRVEGVRLTRAHRALARRIENARRCHAISQTR